MKQNFSKSKEKTKVSKLNKNGLYHPSLLTIAAKMGNQEKIKIGLRKSKRHSKIPSQLFQHTNYSKNYMNLDKTNTDS